MTLRDSLGNIIHKGSALFFKPLNMICEVDEIVQGGIIPGNGMKPTPSCLVLKVKVPFEFKGSDTTMNEVICVVDPRAQRVVEDISSKLVEMPEKSN